MGLIFYDEKGRTTAIGGEKQNNIRRPSIQRNSFILIACMGLCE
jgi:hypothetical protein